MSRYLRITIDAAGLSERGERLVDRLVKEVGPFTDEKMGRRLNEAIVNGDIEIDGVSDAEDHGGS